MTITAQSGVFSFGVQPAKGTLASTWYRHKALAIQMGAITEKEQAPPEVGGANNPTGAYKSGSYFAGRASLLPRLEGDIAWILYLLTGHVASAANATTGYSHVFSQAPVANGGAIFLPWGSFRRHIPGKTTADDLGEIGLDCVLNAATFTLPAAGPLSMDIDVTGRVPSLDGAPDLWTYADNYEEFGSVPMSMKGGVRLPNFAPFAGEEIPATGARITVANNTTTVREERIIGSYHPDDFAPRQRVFTVQFTYKWKDPELFRFIFNGGNPADADFKPCITYTDFEATVETPCDIDPGSIDFPWKLTFYAPKMDWREAGPLQLAGDDILMQNYVGIALEADSQAPEDYYTITLDNNVDTYTIPVP